MTKQTRTRCDRVSPSAKRFHPKGEITNAASIFKQHFTNSMNEREVVWMYKTSRQRKAAEDTSNSRIVPIDKPDRQAKQTAFKLTKQSNVAFDLRLSFGRQFLASDRKRLRPKQLTTSVRKEKKQ